jgi:hypothetical protein
MKNSWPVRHQQSSGPLHACIIDNLVAVQAVVRQGFAEGSPLCLCVTYHYRAGMGPAYTVMIGRTTVRSRADAWLASSVTDLIGAVDKSIARPYRRAA